VRSLDERLRLQARDGEGDPSELANACRRAGVGEPPRLAKWAPCNVDGSGNGSGYGYGYGNGDGSDNGSGYGYGYGNGDGSDTMENKPREGAMIGQFEGQEVVVRSDQSGVWQGVLQRWEGDEVLLATARRAHYWEGAGSCSGLALVGPTGGRITPPVSEVVVLGCCEVLPATPEAVAAWKSLEPWTGRA
jgi:hypothetical protein